MISSPKTWDQGSHCNFGISQVWAVDRHNSSALTGTFYFVAWSESILPQSALMASLP
jgi:hypothetical protein